MEKLYIFEIMRNQGTASKGRSELKRRIITSAIMIPIVAAMVWFDQPIPWFTLLAAGWGAGAVHEFYGIVKHSRGLSPLTYFGMLWVVLFIVSHYFDQIPNPVNLDPRYLLLTIAIILPLVILLWRRGKENAFANWAWTVAGILYIGWLLSFYVELRSLADGRGWVFLAILTTFASDTGAYFTGRAIGRHKLAPYISPKKTWEGVVGGVLGAIVASVVLSFLLSLPLLWWGAIIAGILISVIGQLGDLVKSLFKRNMAIKDSGNVLPGHGGLIDRMDSLAFAGVLVYYFVVFVGVS
jgi:phosphatidate cytidylyltransferase